MTSSLFEDNLAKRSCAVCHCYSNCPGRHPGEGFVNRLSATDDRERQIAQGPGAASRPFISARLLRIDRDSSEVSATLSAARVAFARGFVYASRRQNALSNI